MNGVLIWYYEPKVKRITNCNECIPVFLNEGKVRYCPNTMKIINNKVIPKWCPRRGEVTPKPIGERRESGMNKLTDMEKLILENVNGAVNKAVIEILGGYQSPLKNLVADACKVFDADLRKIVYDSFKEAIDRADFKQSVKDAFDHKVARTMVDSMASSIDRAINTIKSDPTLKARMVLAIETIIEESTRKEK